MGRYTVRWTARTVHIGGAADRAAELGLDHRACRELDFPAGRVDTAARSTDDPFEVAAFARDCSQRAHRRLCETCRTTIAAVAHDERDNAARAWTLWGFRDRRKMRNPLPLASGTLRQMRAELPHLQAEGWTCAIYRAGDAPTALRQQAAEAFAGR